MSRNELGRIQISLLSLAFSVGPIGLPACSDPPTSPTAQEIVERLKGDPAFLQAVASALQPSRDGKDGMKGDKGDPGPAGAKGDPGPAGSQGLAGAQGPAGSQGPAGATGSAGPMGPSGPTGPSGAPGAAGAPGVAGTPGAAGPKGDKGDPGLGRFCGVTSPTTGLAKSGAMNGARAARILCQTACGDASAHVCNRAEASLSWQAWLFPASESWVSQPGNYVNGTTTISDCNKFPALGNGDQWLAEDSMYYGSVWFGGGVTCDTALPLACCK